MQKYTGNNYMCFRKYHKTKTKCLRGFTPKYDKEPAVYNHVPSLPWGLQVLSGEILEVCSEKQELNQNVPYRYSYLA